MKPRPIIYQVLTRLFGNKKTVNKPWGSIEENGVGKFSDFSAPALRKIKKMGFTHVWYTGVIEHAVLTDYTAFGIPLDAADIVKGRAGSPYAIKDYYDINPDLAQHVPDRIQEFEHLIARTHQEGLMVIIDFVPNHVARYYHSDARPADAEDFGGDDDTTKSFDPQNNYYYIPGESLKVPVDNHSFEAFDFPTKGKGFVETPAKATGNDVFSSSPSLTDWYETVKLNYGVNYLNGKSHHFEPIPDTWQKMRHILLYWASKKVDGFRCDMAEMVPVDFWQWVTHEVKKEFPDLLFIAESYDPGNYRDLLFRGGFDFLYDKVELYDTLKAVIRGDCSADAITQVWQRQEGIQDRMLRFLENHDEQRIASPYFAGDMKKGLPMMAATAYMHKGPVMVYFGQEVGEPAAGVAGFSGDDGRTTIFDYWGVPEHQKWMNDGAFNGALLSDDQKKLRDGYIRILRNCNEQTEFRKGQFFDLQYYNRNERFCGYSGNVFSFLRYARQKASLVVINFGEKTEQINLKIPDEALLGFTPSKDQVGLVYEDQPGEVTPTERLTSYDTPGIILTLPPFSFEVVQLESI